MSLSHRPVLSAAPLFALLMVTSANGIGCGGGQILPSGSGSSDGGSDDAAGDVGSCQCSGPAPAAPNVQCPDGSTAGPECALHLDGTCAWEIRACPDAGAMDGGSCVSQKGGPCGGNTTRPCTCGVGLSCNPRISGGGDIPGTCCPGLGCAPNCPNGVLKDSDGCETCQCAPPTDAGSTGVACAIDSDCANGGVCGYRESDGCSAAGSCFPAPGAVCLLYSPGCACDGSEISVACTGLPSGYVSKPLRHTGACVDGG
jgi:hypothetical protein